MIEVRQTPVFSTWFAKLRDIKAQAKIAARIRRAELGNLGDHKPLQGPVSEMRIDHGQGYRIYFTRRGNALVILLAGGDKRSQDRDIRLAVQLEKEID